jgi:hypothetical protein
MPQPDKTYFKYLITDPPPKKLKICCDPPWQKSNEITFDVSVEPVMLIKFAPASVARAFAKSVFPVPGGPKSKTPLQG